MLLMVATLRDVVCTLLRKRQLCELYLFPVTGRGVKLECTLSGATQQQTDGQRNWLNTNYNFTQFVNIIIRI